MDVVVEVPIANGEEELALGSVLNQLCDPERMANTLGLQPAFYMVKTILRGEGLIKRIVYEERQVAEVFETLWADAQLKLPQ